MNILVVPPFPLCKHCHKSCWDRSLLSTTRLTRWRCGSLGYNPSVPSHKRHYHHDGYGYRLIILIGSDIGRLQKPEESATLSDVFDPTQTSDRCSWVWQNSAVTEKPAQETNGNTRNRAPRNKYSSELAILKLGSVSNPMKLKRVSQLGVATPSTDDNRSV